MGLTLCVVAGADLDTSNCMYSSIAVYEGGCTRGQGQGRASCRPRAVQPLLLRRRAFSHNARCSLASPGRQPSCGQPSAAQTLCKGLPCAGRYGLLGMLRCLAGSYLCNLVGALLLVGLMVGGEVFEGRADFVIE